MKLIGLENIRFRDGVEKILCAEADIKVPEYPWDRLRLRLKMFSDVLSNHIVRSLSDEIGSN